MRSLGITFLSLALTLTVIGNAYYQKKQFYPSVVYITKSNPSMAVIYIQAFILVYLLGKLMRKIFFGQLRAAEFEHLMERSWYAITETCLAFTVFRDDFNPKFVALFTVLLFLKSFHWLAEDRVDYMERSPVISLIFHLRVLSLLALLSILDIHFVSHAYYSTVTKGASVQLVFGFEYAILMTMVINIAIKYALHSVDLNSENPWENKAVFLLYTELIMGLIKVLLYVAFVAIMVRIYTLPLFAFRPMYYTMRNFKKAFNDVILSRRAIRNMNTLYPDATPEELQAADNVCIICREEMVTASKKLPCNHIFHTACLRSWFQRQQTCPTCRLNILRPASNTTNRNAAAPQARPPPQPAGNVLGGVPGINPFQLFGGVNPFQAAAQAGVNPFQAAAQAGVNPFQAAAQPGRLQVNQPAATPNVAPGTGTTATTSTTGPTPPSPPFGLPPFPFMPFSIPPPLPPNNLAQLSTEELQRLEGTERENIEARIQLLRNIQLMLDTSVIMMQQYSAAAATSLSSVRMTVDPNMTATASTSTSNASSSKTENGIHQADASSTTDSQSDLSSTAKETKENITTNDTIILPNDEHDEIRRRRLQRFQAAEQAQQ